jgi:chaperone BCS1
VSSKTSQRKWSIGLTKDSNGKKGEVESAEYTPTYDAPQLWRWGGYWIEVTRYHVPAPLMNEYSPPGPRNTVGSSLYLTIYTFDVQVLSRLVETARAKYSEISRPYVLVHSMDTVCHCGNFNCMGTRSLTSLLQTQPSYGPVMTWNNVKRKNRRPMESIILAEGVLDSITKDAREFINMEEWYLDAGIPHRRGYLLHGPPGTGKTSTIYALAGELGMEIYSLSLASNFVDDNVLNRAAAAIPKNSIFLIEDIDCAFPSREDEDDDETVNGAMMGPGGYMMPGYHRGVVRVGVRSAVTLSGLLNVLDGVGSEEGKLFFATTNYIDHLDPALMRPGRIDMKIQYHLANKMQAAALFKRFFPTKHVKLFDIPSSALSLIDHPLPSGAIDTDADSEKTQEAKDAEKDAAISAYLADLAESFSKGVPKSEFSTAELQGYLLIHKREPLKAASCVGEWVASERKLREDKKKRDEEKKAKMKAKAQEMWGAGPMGGGAFGGMRPPAPFTPPLPPPIPVVPVAARPGDLPLLPTPDLDKQGLTLPVSESSGSLVVV